MKSHDESNSELMKELYEGLRVIEESAFPKKCLSCGRLYSTMDDLIRETNDVSSSTGLARVEHPKGASFVGLFRNCVCDSTLLVTCHDRRTTDPEGATQRRLFGKLLRSLGQAGLDTKVARKELRKVIRGENSEVLSRLGMEAVPLHGK